MNDKEKEIVGLVTNLMFRSCCAGVAFAEGRDKADLVLRDCVMDMIHLLALLEIPGFKV